MVGKSYFRDNSRQLYFLLFKNKRQNTMNDPRLIPKTVPINLMMVCFVMFLGVAAAITSALFIASTLERLGFGDVVMFGPLSLASALILLLGLGKPAAIMMSRIWNHHDLFIHQEIRFLMTTLKVLLISLSFLGTQLSFDLYFNNFPYQQKIIEERINIENIYTDSAIFVSQLARKTNSHLPGQDDIRSAWLKRLSDQKNQALADLEAKAMTKENQLAAIENFQQLLSFWNINLSYHHITWIGASLAGLTLEIMAYLGLTLLASVLQAPNIKNV